MTVLKIISGKKKLLFLAGLMNWSAKSHIKVLLWNLYGKNLQGLFRDPFYYLKFTRRWSKIYKQDRGPQRRDETQVNEKITVKSMLVIDDEGTQLGRMSKQDAINAAYDKNLDLVLVSPNPKNAVAKMMDYSRYRYEQQKKAKEMKKKQNIVVLQEIKLSPTIEKNDVDTKIRVAEKIIAKGNKVKVSIRFRGRMIVHKEIGRQVILSFCEKLSEISSVETRVKMDGRIMYTILSPKKD